MTLDQPTERQPPLKCVVLNVEYCWLSLGYGKPTLQQVSSCILSLSTQQQVSFDLPEVVAPQPSHQRAPCATSWHSLDAAASATVNNYTTK